MQPFIGRELRASYPEAKIIVIDSLCASLGEGLLVHYAVQMKEERKSIEEISEWVENNRLHICHQFTVDDLIYLHRGGRIKKSIAILGTLINVKPVMHVDNEGRLVPLNNVRGRKKSLNALVDNMGAAIEGCKNDWVFISHGDALEDAEYVRNLVQERFGVQNFIINPVSPTIGSHSGPGTIALFYFGNQRLMRSVHSDSPESTESTSVYLSNFNPHSELWSGGFFSNTVTELDITFI